MARSRRLSSSITVTDQFCGAGGSTIGAVKAGLNVRPPGELVSCSCCHDRKPWRVGIFKSEGGKPRQPCVQCDSAARAARAAKNPERERSNGRERTARWRARHPDKVRAANRRPRSVVQEFPQVREAAQR